MIGWPVAHSRSPLIHNYWLKQLRDCRRLSARSGDAGGFCRLRRIARRARLCRRQRHRAAQGGGAGAVASPTIARAPSAPPTPYGSTDGVLRSTNTDVEGFLANLDACAPGWDRNARSKRSCSAPAARARAVIYGLFARGIGRIVVANRTFERAEALRKSSAPPCNRRPGKSLAGAACRRRAPGQHHDARHGRDSPRSTSTSRCFPPTPSSPISSMCRS